MNTNFITSIIRDKLAEFRAIGQEALDQFIEDHKHDKSGYNINWGDISLIDVSLTIDEEGDTRIIFEFSEGNCPKFNNTLIKLIDCTYTYNSGKRTQEYNFRFEVRSEW